MQQLLGHKHVQTTMIYTHVAGKDFVKVQSPLDRLEEVHEALGEFLVQVNMKFVEDPTIEAPKPPEVSASISHPRIFRP